MARLLKLKRLSIIVMALCHVSAFAGSQLSQPSLLSQAKELPADFVSYLFDAPLFVRVELNDQYLGDAMVMLNRKEQVQLLRFTEAHSSKYSEQDRTAWADSLQNFTNLGKCTTKCPNNILALYYNLNESKLSILTADAEQNTVGRHYQLPENGSKGLMLENRLNVTAAEHQQANVNYNFNATASRGLWSYHAGGQFVKSDFAEEKNMYGIDQLYGQTEFEDNFVRVGYFYNGIEGLSLRPQQLGNNTMLGAMYSSSDALVRVENTPSSTPIYVTANKQASVELYKNGALIHSQSVPSGLQTVDTRQLPTGIYPVLVRLIEDGQVISETEEMVYKPTSWRDPSQKLRYSFFAGQESNFLSGTTNNADERFTLGAAVNYLLKPQLVGGASIQTRGSELEMGASFDWTLFDQTRMLTNVLHSTEFGMAADMQLMHPLNFGYVVLGHRYSKKDLSEALTEQAQHISSLSLSYRLTRDQNMMMRVSRQNNQGTAYDISWRYNSSVLNAPAVWNLSAFNRPGNKGTKFERQQGIELGVNIRFGDSSQDRNRYNAAIGSRTSTSGKKEQVLDLGWQGTYSDSIIKQLSANASVNSSGVGLSGAGSVDNDVVQADMFINTAAGSGSLSGGLNLQNSVVLGTEGAVASSASLFNGAALTVELISDAPDVPVMAYDSNGGQYQLKPGKNLVPVTAFKPGTVSFDLAQGRTDNISLSKSSQSYQLNKGGVEHVQLSVHKTVTVLGRLLDTLGKPLGGSHVINHASRTVTEHSGFFSVEMREATPTLKVVYQGEELCDIELNTSHTTRQDNVVMVGDVQCGVAVANKETE